MLSIFFIEISLCWFIFFAIYALQVYRAESLFSLTESKNACDKSLLKNGEVSGITADKVHSNDDYKQIADS